MKFSSIFRDIQFILLLCAVCILVSPVRADDSQNTSSEFKSVQINVFAGFEGYYRPNVPAPLSVEIINQEKKQLDGKLIVKTVKWNPPTEYSLNISVPAGEKKRFGMYFYEGNTSNLSVGLVDSKGWTVTTKTVPILPVQVQERSQGRLGITGEALVLSLSESVDDFAFLQEGSMTEPRLFRAKSNDHVQSQIPNYYSINNIWVTHVAPPQLTENLLAWSPVNSVICDLGSYLKLDASLKKYLQAWVMLGGELLLYPPDNGLSETDIESLKSDSFLPFKPGSSPSQIEIKSDLLKAGKIEVLPEITSAKPVNSYSFDQSGIPMIDSYAISSGGLTLFRFNPAYINTEKINDWVILFYELGLITPVMHQYSVKTDFTSVVSARANNSGSIPTIMERTSAAASRTMIRTFFTAVIPILLIILIGLICEKRKQRRIFIIYLLPALIVLALLIPPMIINRTSFDAFQFEGYNLLELPGKGFPGTLHSNILIIKQFPDRGNISVTCPDGFTFYDEMVSLGQDKIPTAKVDLDPPGSFISAQQSVGQFRHIIAMNENDAGFISGVIKVISDEKMEYEIVNNTKFVLTNCEIYPVNPNITQPRLPMRVPDIPAGKSIKGELTGTRDDVTRDNEEIEAFSHKIEQGIFSANSRKEIIFALETVASGDAYKPSRPAEAYAGEVQFFAWTDEYNRHVKIGDHSGKGSEITLVLAKLPVVENRIMENSHIYPIISLTAPSERTQRQSNQPEQTVQNP